MWIIIEYFDTISNSLLFLMANLGIFLFATTGNTTRNVLLYDLQSCSETIYRVENKVLIITYLHIKYNHNLIKIHSATSLSFDFAVQFLKKPLIVSVNYHIICLYHFGFGMIEINIPFCYQFVATI